jgi:hypothetical protein
MANACNKGLALAKYEVISWLGPDDTFIPGAFQTVVDYFRTHLDSSFLIGSHHLVRNDGSLIRYERSKYTNREELIKYWKFWWKTIVLPFHATFYRRSVHDTLGAYDERFRFFDYEFYLRASRSFQFITLPEPLTNFRYDEGSGTFAGGWEKEFLTASREHWGYPPSWRLLKYLCSYASHARRKQNLDYRSAARLILQCLMGNKVLAGGDNS